MRPMKTATPIGTLLQTFLLMRKGLKEGGEREYGSSISVDSHPKTPPPRYLLGESAPKNWTRGSCNKEDTYDDASVKSALLEGHYLIDDS